MAAVRAQLVAGDAGSITAWNESARAEHARLLGAAGEQDEVSQLRTSVPNRPGVIAEIALALGGAGVNILDMALSPSEDNSQGIVALWIAGERDTARARELIAGLGFAVALA
jgi:prephenate dehydrogenase